MAQCVVPGTTATINADGDIQSDWQQFGQRLRKIAERHIIVNLCTLAASTIELSISVFAVTVMVSFPASNVLAVTLLTVPMISLSSTPI